MSNSVVVDVVDVADVVDVVDVVVSYFAKFIYRFTRKEKWKLRYTTGILNNCKKVLVD